MAAFSGTGLELDCSHAAPVANCMKHCMGRRAARLGLATPSWTTGTVFKEVGIRWVIPLLKSRQAIVCWQS
jgi:hypothetical protein